ncbi:unnamed protein product [Rhizoctonia solani]|uniref:Glutathione transferase n=1 Tax=Rhizoctonia solani TaxID=456999 RepID=A0A8H3HXM5_9AGAM|nr:unnamed protein product [Rhizoctonia solani]
MTPPVANNTSATSNGSIPPTASNPEDDYQYAHLLPGFDKSEFYPPLEPFEFTDPGTRAAALPVSEQRAFLKNATRVRNLTPGIGTEVVGIDLTSLDGPARDQLALEVARRCVVVFRDQPKFLAQTAEQFREWGSYFGRLLIHPVSGHPPGIPELHVTYRDPNVVNRGQFNRLSTTFWHSDASYELQPPGLTTFFLLAQPSSGGGDTLYVSQVLALKKLSPPFVDFLRTLKAVHSGVLQAQLVKEGHRGGIVRREPVEYGIRHPATGEEALFVNKLFTRYIVGLKQEESTAILKLLYEHIACVAEAQVRVSMPFSVCTKRVWLAAKEVGVDVKFVFVEMIKRQHKEPSYIENTTHLDEDGTKIYESRAIARYLVAKYGKDSPLLPNPSDVKAYGSFEQAASIEYSAFDQPAHTIISHKIFRVRKGLPVDEELVQKCVDTLNTKMEGYELILSKQNLTPHVQVFTLADLFHLPCGGMVDQLYPEIFSSKPHVKAWWADITSRESWQAAQVFNRPSSK